MSIHEFFNKIKGYIPIDMLTLVYSVVVILVGISSFYLGRISVQENSKNDTSIPKLSMVNESGGNTSNSFSNSKNTGYFASKNGKLYYSVGCSAGNRIAEKNIINFSTALEAEEAGYKISPSCK